jgi:hypothetical protein
MKLAVNFLVAAACWVGTLVMAQSVTVAPVTSGASSTLAPAPTSEQDKVMLQRAEGTVKGLENALKDYAVALKPRADSDKHHVGLPLASLGDDRFHVAYDLATKSMAAQWRFAQTKVLGQTLHYQAFVGESGAASIGLSTRF